MKCQLCKTEASIVASRYIVEGDTDENEETKLFLEQDVACRNPHCNNNGVVIHTFRNPIEIGNKQ